MRLIDAYAVGATTVALVLAVVALREARRSRFDALTVGRINVVEPNGTLRMTISNHAQLPDPVIGGKSYPLRTGTGGAGAGIIFFNDEGNENGGLVYTGRTTPAGPEAGESLTFDQFNQDETMTLSYGEGEHRRTAGLSVADRPEESIQAFAESAMVFHRLPDGPEKNQRMQAFQDRMRALGQYGGANRLYAGKGANKEAVVSLADPKGRPRIRMQVDSTGDPTLVFLDTAGRVTYQVPAKGK